MRRKISRSVWTEPPGRSPAKICSLYPSPASSSRASRCGVRTVRDGTGEEQIWIDYTVSLDRSQVLVFPELQSANIAYKLLWRLGKVEAIGPILTGIGAPSR